MPRRKKVTEDTIEAPIVHEEEVVLEVAPVEDAIEEDTSTILEDDNKTLMEDIEKRVSEKLTSRHFSVVSSTTRAAKFDIRNKDGLDYTVNGKFKGFWFRNEPGRLLDARQQRYYLPEEIDSRLKNLTMGNLILMLQTKEASDHYTEQIEKKNRSLEGTQMDKHQRADKRFSEFKSIRPT